MGTTTRYRVGIDVGSHSVGLACVLLDEDNMPTEVRHPLVVVHDANVDPSGGRGERSRRAMRGDRVRARRGKIARSRRLADLDAVLRDLGYPVPPVAVRQDHAAAWVARARLVAEHVPDPAVRRSLIGLAVHHMARHRGRRSPYVDVRTLLRAAPPSEPLVSARAAADALIGDVARVQSPLRVDLGLTHPLPTDATPGQVGAAVVLHERDVAPERRTPLRTKVARRRPAATGSGRAVTTGILSTALMQADHATELWRIADVQGLPRDEVEKLIRVVFHMGSPRGAAAARAGRDALPGQRRHRRALRASVAFQRYRIATVVANLRISAEDSAARRLTPEELTQVVDHLDRPHRDRPTWDDVATMLGVDRSRLTGTAATTADGESCRSRPPTNETERVIADQRASIPATAEWWTTASRTLKDAFIRQLLEHEPADDSAGDSLSRLTPTLGESELTALDSLPLTSGRAAYSEDSLGRLTRRILQDGVDLTEARQREFGVPAQWTPPTPPIGEPVGHPTVDIILTHVARYLRGVTAEMGAPSAVVVEHVRDAFSSAERSAQYERLVRARRRGRERARLLLEQEGVAHPTASDVRRHEAVVRQNGRCLYCGDTITLSSCELDHIVPRSGRGSTNTTENLVAVCVPCNRSKGGALFSMWAAERTGSSSVAAVLDRLEHWDLGSMGGLRAARFRRDVRNRLLRTNADPEIDGRSLESVAWMAREVRARIAHDYERHGDRVTVSVYRGSITAAARAAAGVDGRVHLLRPPAPEGVRPPRPGKSRFDRRHHVVDAAVVALMRPSVAATLSIRESLRDAHRLNPRTERDWSDFEGRAEGDRHVWRRWTASMRRLIDLLNDELDDDRVAVMRPLRLRYPGQVHSESIRPFTTVKVVGDAFTLREIDRASTPAMWCALRAAQDFDPANGLPENRERMLRLQGRHLSADAPLDLFPDAQDLYPKVAVRGGYADIGDSTHHARVYACAGRGGVVYAMMRVYATDLRRHRSRDLFSVPIPPQAISRRVANPPLRRHLDAGTAEDIGWLVVGDELLLDAGLVGTRDNLGKRVVEAYPQVRRWRVAGFPEHDKVLLRPVLLAGEGLLDRGGAPDPAPAVTAAVKGKGWIAPVRAVFAASPVVVRRDALGRPRLTSSAHLPVCWSVTTR